MDVLGKLPTVIITRHRIETRNHFFSLQLVGSYGRHRLTFQGFLKGKKKKVIKSQIERKGVKLVKIAITGYF